MYQFKTKDAPKSKKFTAVYDLSIPSNLTFEKNSPIFLDGKKYIILQIRKIMIKGNIVTVYGKAELWTEEKK